MEVDSNSEENAKFAVWRASSFAQIKDKARMGYNIIGLILLGYYVDVSKRFKCSACPYFFNTACSYNYEKHKENGCKVATRGGYLLNPRESDSIPDPQLTIEPAELSHCSSSNLEENESKKNGELGVHKDLEYAGRKSTLDFDQYKLGLLSTDTSNDKFALLAVREESLEDMQWLQGTSKRVLATIGFFCDHQTNQGLTCYMCKLQIPETLIEGGGNLFSMHAAFSQNCPGLVDCYTEDIGCDASLLLFARLLSKNLTTFGSKCRFGQELSIRCSAAGFRFSSGRQSVVCTKCWLFVKADDVERCEDIAAMHYEKSPNCEVAQNVSRKCVYTSATQYAQSPASSSAPPLKVSLHEDKSKSPFYSYIQDMVGSLCKVRCDASEISGEGGDMWNPMTYVESLDLFEKLSLKEESAGSNVSDNFSGKGEKNALSRCRAASSEKLDDCEMLNGDASNDKQYGNEQITIRSTPFSNSESGAVDFSEVNNIYAPPVAPKTLMYIDHVETNRILLNKVIAPVSVQERASTTKTRTDEQLSRCSVCLESVADRMFVGCGHVATCTDCVMMVPSCPICRARITGVMPVEFPIKQETPQFLGLSASNI